MSLQFRIFVASIYSGAHPLGMDTLVEMSKAQMHCAYSKRVRVHTRFVHPCAHKKDSLYNKIPKIK